MINRSVLTRLVITFITISGAFAQQTHAADNDPGIWTVFSTTDSFSSEQGSSRWQYWLDVQARYFDVGSGTNQWLVRPGIGYEIRKGVNAWAGYARFRTRNSSGRVIDENRYWQQVDWRAGQWRDGQVSMRVRFEERSIESGDDLGVVLRFMAKYVRPFPGSADKSLILAIEPFVDLRDTDWGGDAGLGQNRTFLGIGWRLSDKLTLETGYMNQFIWVDGAEDRTNHLAMLTLKAKF